MADITSPQAAAFSNEIARPMSDIIMQAYRASDKFMLEIVNFEAVVAGNANGDVILDGSETDGRTPLTKENISDVKFVVEQFRAVFTDPYRATVLERAAVNTRPPF